MKRTRFGKSRYNQNPLYKYSFDQYLYNQQHGDYNYDKQQLELLRYPDAEKTTWEKVQNFGKSTADMVTVDLPNSLRMLCERIVDGKINAGEAQKHLINLEDDDLEKITSYYDLLNQYMNSEDVEQKGLIYEKIKEYDNFFMGEGRSHDAIAQLMYDTRNLPEEMKPGYGKEEAFQFAIKDNDQYPTFKSSDSVLDTVKKAGSAALTFLDNSVTSTLNFVQPYLQRPLSKFGNFFGNQKYITNQAIKSSVANPTDFNNYLPYLYSGGVYNTNDGTEYIKMDSKLMDLVNAWKEYNKNRQEELRQYDAANHWAKRKGMMKIPFANTYLNIWDPQDVSPEWRKAMEEHSGEFWHPLYMLPELGSSIGLMEGTVEVMGLNIASLYVINKLPVWASKMIGGSKVKLAQKGGMAILGHLPEITAGIRSAEIGASFNILANQRYKETMMEASEGVTSRIMADAFYGNVNKADGQKVFGTIIDYAENELGISTQGMEPKDLIGLAMAYDINTGDPVFEAAKKNSYNGLMKLINANNALALHDYLETLPWLGFGEQALSRFSSMISNKLAGISTVASPAKGWLQSPSALWRDISTEYNRNLTTNAITRLSGNKLPLLYANAMMDARNSYIDNLAQAFIKRDMPKLGLVTKTTGDYLANFAKRAAFTATVEGFEEGQQNILQQRYKSGQYDDYKNPYSIFSIPEAFKSLELTKYSFEALFGLHGSDDAETRKAMAIGAFISPLMGIGYNAVTNISGDPGYNNLRNLLGQLRTDVYMGKAVQNNYKELGDTKHLSIFYDAYRKAGVDGSNVVTSLNNLKLGIDKNNSLVEEDYIDRDIQLAITAWQQYNDDQLAKNAEKEGIARYSDAYKEMIIQNAMVIADAKDSAKNLAAKLSEIHNLDNGLRQDLFQYINSETSEERKQLISLRNPIVTVLAELLNNYYNKYQSTLQNWNRQTRSKRKEAYQNMSIEDLSKQMYDDSTSWFDRFDNERLHAQGRRLSKDEVKTMLQSDETLYDDFIDYLTDYGIQVQSRDAIYNKILDEYLLLQRLNVAKLLLQASQDRQEFLLNFRALTGKDIDLFKIGGYVDTLEQLAEMYQKQHDKAVSKRNKIIDFILDTSEDENLSITKAQTLEDFFSGEMSLNLGIEDLLRSMYGDMMLLNAAYSNQSLLADVIRNNDSHSAEELKNAIVGKNGQSELFDDLIAEYKSESEKQVSEMDEVVGDVDKNEKLRNLRKKAAWAYIIDRVKLKEDRKYITHKNILSVLEQDGEGLQEEREEEREESAEEQVQTVDDRQETQPEPEPVQPQEQRQEEPPVEPEPEPLATEQLEENGGGELPVEDEDVEEEPQEENNEELEPMLDDDGADDNDYQNAEEPDVNDNKKFEEVGQPDVAIEAPETEPEVFTEPGDAEGPITPIPESDNEPIIDIPADDSVTGELSQDIDISQLNLINGKWMLNDKEVEDYIMNALLDIQTNMMLLEQGVRAISYDMPGRSKNYQNAQTQYDLDASDMLSSTFWYEPDPRDKEGRPTNEVIKLSINGELIKLKYNLHSGRELAKKLIQKGWFQKVDKYYVVTQSEEARKYFERHPDIKPTKQQLADTYTVSLILEDSEEQACYACSLRQLGVYKSLMGSINRLTGEPIIDEKTGLQQQEEIEKNNEEIERRRYETHGIRNSSETSMQAIERIQQEAAKVLVHMYYAMLGEEISEKTARKWVDGFYTTTKHDSESQEAYELRQARVQELIRNAKNQARKHLAKPGKKILDYTQIDEMIAKLRRHRNAIIDAYMDKDASGNYVFPKNVKTSVKPDPNSTNISNGKFANVKTSEHIPQLSIVSKDGNPFGLPNDVKQLSELIESGGILIGYGTGMVRSNNPFHILDIRNKSILHENGGVAGKIFLNVETVNDTKVPLMLVELKFNVQYRKSGTQFYINNPSDLKLCIDPYTGEINSDEYNPSAAEVLLYMMFGKLNSKYIPGAQMFAQQVQKQFSEFIVNQGEKTLLQNDKVEDRLPYYAAKQLSVKDGILSIGIQQTLEDGKTVYRKKEFPENEIFSNEPAAIENRIKIISAIANQMHWNTELNIMNVKFGGPETKLIIDSLRNFFKNNKTASSFTIAGVKEFTFNKEDLFQLDKHGAPIRVIPNTIAAAWMIKTGRILTDVGDDVFYAPYVYASGLELTHTPSSDAEILGVGNSGSIDMNELLRNDAVAQNIVGQIKSINDFYKNDTEYEILVTQVDRAKNNANYKKNGAKIKSIMIDMSKGPSGKFENEDLFSEALINKVNGLVLALNSSKNQLDLEDGAELKFDTNIKYDTLLTDAYQTANGIKGKNVIAVVNVYEKGRVEIVLQRYEGIGGVLQQYVNGVYSTEATEGIFDESFTRKWLEDTLGIKDRQIIITDAVLRSIENRTVYGVTLMLFDSISNESEGRFILSRKGGKSLPFHEAWHYVNLLVHDRKTRRAIYEDFAKYNKDAKGKLFKDIEELMAEDYRMWQQHALDHPISYKTKMFFSDIAEFLHIIQKKPLYQKVYRNIYGGMYKKAHLDLESAKQFLDNYNSLVYAIDIPGVPREQTKNFVSIDDYYEVGNAIVDYAIQIYNIDTVDKVNDLMGKEGFVKFKLYLEYLRDDVDNKTAEVIDTFIQNQSALYHILASRFEDLGIKVTEKEVKAKEETNENVWDRYQFSVPKKDNAGPLAKLFMRQIVSSYWQYSKDGKPIFTTEKNKRIPYIPKYVPFDECWNKITKEVGYCNSYGDLLLDIDGNIVKDGDGNAVYDPTSLRGIVKRLAKSDSFFEAVDRKLDQIDDNANLKSQLYATINSHTPNMSSISIQTQLRTIAAMNTADPSIYDLPADLIQKMNQEREAAFISERRKQWIIQNDNTLRAARNIPRKWSQALLMQGLIDRSDNSFKISKSYAKRLTENKNSIVNRIDNLLDPREIHKNKEADLRTIKNDVVLLLNLMGIRCDQQSFDFFLTLDFEKSGDVISTDTVLKHIKDLIGSKTAGTVGYFIAIINNNIGNESYKKSATGTLLKNEIDVDKTYVGTQLSSKITKLALAYNAMHPSTEEYAVKLPNGEMGYPNSQNNSISTEYRLLNTTNGERAIEKMQSPYCKHSLLLNAAAEFDDNTPDSQKIILNLNTGMSSDSYQDGSDYFGITAMEDYLINMLLLDQDPMFGVNEKNRYNNEYTHLISPTMADKKTHYDVQTKSIRTVHDCVLGFLPTSLVEQWINKNNPYINNPELSELENNIARTNHMQSAKQELEASNYAQIVQDKSLNYKRFSNETLRIFAEYFLDELESLIQYYDKENIQYLISHPSKLIKNFHGSVKNGKMQFDGNGGLFRYFYDIFSLNKDGLMNLNQKLEYLYKLQEKIQKGEVKSVKGEDVGLVDVDTSISIETVDRADGFELIRDYLKKLKGYLFDDDGNGTQALFSAINAKLIDQTKIALIDVSTDINRILCNYNTAAGCYAPHAIPQQLLQRLALRFRDKKHPYSISEKYVPYTKNSYYIDAAMFYSLMANHVANTAISIIEFEKVNSGDPAAFKYAYVSKKDNPGNEETVKFSVPVELQTGKTILEEIEVKNLKEKDSDKTKRFGSLLSPGDEIRTDYKREELDSDEDYYYLNNGNFTNLTIKDFVAQSKFLQDEIIPRFETQLIVDYVRKFKNKKINDYLQARIDKAGKNNYDIERFIQDIYTNNHGIRDDVKKMLQDSGAYDTFIKTNLESQYGPYLKINVSDALVLLRPAVYRKIRKGLGKWNDDDEEAYRILETNGDWMSDAELSKKVSKLELYPLKLNYYGNDIRKISENNTITVQVLNKLACFPLFKFLALSETGKQLYKRMNQSGNEIDFLSFDSAVKVGQALNAPSAYDEKIIDIKEVGSWINRPNSQSIDYSTKKIVPNEQEDALPITIQDFRFLRYQLNTKSHEADNRNIGTQVFKIIYQNLYDDAQYGSTLEYIDPQQGHQLKSDIIACINSLTLKGANDVRSRLYYYDKAADKYIPSDNKIDDLVKEIVERQGLGVTAEDIVNNGYMAESLVNRTVFEQAICSYVNDKTIGINTNGGSAIQQSIFGFTDYTNNHVGWSDNFRNYNDGEEIKWYRKDGTIEVLLSMNFFKSVVPKEISDDYKSMRSWLVEHDIIKGTKQDGTKSEGKAFGIAYRIPTQGLSSAFAITVADIMPKQVGDLIVLPREITSQTGADYDVDKIYLATLSYEDGQLVMPDGDIDRKWNLLQRMEYYAKLNKKAIQNRLLFDYMSILQDPKSFALGRKSIDVIVDNIKDNFVRKVQPAQTKYRKGMYELLPGYQSDKKLEFITGKDGIGAFALSITNLTLTQQVHLTMKYDEVAKQYGFGDLDEIQGEDGSYIADWLSAMVSLHVDVAKDPVIKDINVNPSTYNHTAFLLRAGKGISTFSFLAQPILVKYASILMQSRGLYGRYLTGTETTNKTTSKRMSNIRRQLIKEYVSNIERLISQLGDNEKSEISKIRIGLLRYKYDSSNDKNERAKLKVKGKAPEYVIDRSSIFDFDLALKHIQVLNNKNSSILDKIKAYLFNLNCLTAFEEIKKYSEPLSDLVKVSRIDTEKFGNTIMQHMNFRNRMLKMKYSGSSPWIIKTASSEMNEIPSYAMKKYFEDTFLLIKFDTATNLVKQILRRQLLAGTKLMQNLFEIISSQINGVMTYSVPVYEKDKKTGKYKPKVKINQKTGQRVYYVDKLDTFEPYNDMDTVDRIYKAMDNIARFNILFNSSKSAVEKQKMLTDENNSGYNSDPIDLSFGGDFYKMLRTVASLILGSKEESSLPIRVHKFVQEIVKNPNSSKASGLVKDGKIINDFLLYLYPIPSFKNNNIDRMFLNESIIRTANYKKEKLIADFGVLLNHSDEFVRNLAKDLVIYAYYTSYDTSGRNQFFELVPEYYRRGYDEAIKNALRSSDKAALTNALKSPIQDTDENQLGEYYLDIIARNYWYDDKIVKPIYFVTNNKFKPTTHGHLEFRPAEFNWKDPETKLIFPGLNITTNEFKNPMFVKSRKRQTTVLYKRVGSIKIKYGQKDKKNIVGTASIYMAVQKAGSLSGGTRFFEFFKGFGIPSIYKENMLPSVFNEEEMWNYLYKIVEKFNASQLEQDSKKGNKNGTFVLQIERTLPKLNLSEENEQIYNLAVYKNYTGDIKKKTLSAFDGQISVVPNKKSISYVTNSSDMIINFGNPKDSKGNVIPDKTKIDLQNIFDENGQLNIDAISESIMQFEKSMSDFDKERKNRLSFNIDENLIPVSETEIEEFVNRSLEFVKNNDRSLTEEQLEEYKNTFEENAVEQIKLVKMFQLCDISIKIFKTLGVNIEQVISSKMTNLSRAAMTAAYNNRFIIGKDNTELSLKGTLYLSNSDIRSDEYETYMYTMDSGINSFLYEIDEESAEESEEAEVDFAEQIQESLGILEGLLQQKIDEILEESSNKNAKKSEKDLDIIETDEILIDLGDEFANIDNLEILNDSKKDPESENKPNNEHC